ncbi:MAG: hypothetical protein WC426_09360 [Sulfuriferula sp.]
MEDFQAKAQEMVDIQRQIRQLEERRNTLKYEIIAEVLNRGQITCNGGVVLPVGGFDVNRLDQDALRFELQSRLSLTEGEANEIIQASRVAGSRLPTIMVRLA